MLLLASITILFTADGDGASGRQFAPRLPAVAGVQLKATGYRAMTQGGRVCFADDLDVFQRLIKTELRRRSSRPIWALHTRWSWILSATKSELLPDLLESEPRWHEALEESWQAQNGEMIQCAALKAGESAAEPTLNSDLKTWEIRWLARGELPRVGRVTEIARPIGDGARRLHRVDDLRRQDPLRLWVSLGRVLEGWSWVRDGPSLHRTTTANWLKNRGPDVLLPSKEDAVIGIDGLRRELATMKTQMLTSFAAKGQPSERGVILLRGGERIALIGVTDAFDQLPEAKREKRLSAVFRALSETGPIHRAILLARRGTDVAPYLDDPRFQIIAVPSGLNLSPRKGSFSIAQRPAALRDRQPPVLIRVPSNAVVELTIEAGSAKLTGHKVDERVPAVKELAQRVNAVRHELYPKLVRPLIPAPEDGYFDAQKTVDLVSGIVLRKADADALLLPKLEHFLALPGGLSRLDLLARLTLPSPLVRLTVDGGLLAKAVQTQKSSFRSREKLVAGRPLRLVTTENLANALQTSLGKRDRHLIALEGGRLVPTDRSATLPRAVLPLLEASFPQPSSARLSALLDPPTQRPRLILRIDKFQLSAFANELRAPNARRAAEDTRTNQPSRTSLGGNLDLRLLQPVGDLIASVRLLAAYTRDLFPQDGAVAALDKESVDDWALTTELMLGSGLLRPFANVVFDSEFSAGDPTSPLSAPRQSRVEINAGIAIPKKGNLHEARLAATGAQDLTRILAEADPTPNESLPGWRFAVSGMGDWRRKVGGVETRLLIDARIYLPESEPLPSTLLWALGERLEFSVPFALGLRGAIVLGHTLWRTHADDGPDGLGDNQLYAGFSLDFRRVLRPLAGLF